MSNDLKHYQDLQTADKKKISDVEESIQSLKEELAANSEAMQTALLSNDVATYTEKVARKEQLEKMIPEMEQGLLRMKREAQPSYTDKQLEADWRVYEAAQYSAMSEDYAAIQTALQELLPDLQSLYADYVAVKNASVDWGMLNTGRQAYPLNCEYDMDMIHKIITAITGQRV